MPLIHPSRSTAPGLRNPRQSGLSMIEMLLALGGFALLSVGITEQVRLYNDRAEAATVAGEMRLIATAAERYMRDNYSAGENLISQVSPGSPVTVPIGAMSDYLPSGFNARVGRTQTACALVGQAADESPLEGMVVTTGGDPYSDSFVSRIRAELGAIGAAVFSDSDTFGEGFQGRSFSLEGSALSNLGFDGAGECPLGTEVVSGAVALEPGHPAAFLEVRPDRFDAGVLYRNAIAGREELNRMNTDLDMGANNINNVENVNVNENVFAGGNLIARENIGSTEGNVVAVNEANEANAGLFIGDNLILRDTEIDGAEVRANNAVYYASVIQAGDTVPKPQCNARGIPERSESVAQIHGGVASAMLRETAPGLGVNAIPYVASYIQVTDLGDEWEVTLWLMDFDGVWRSHDATAVAADSDTTPAEPPNSAGRFVDPDFSRLSMFVKCAG